MKKLTRLLLINWHFFQHQIIEFGDINFLTGKNSAGKSTIIDALQIALLGEIRSSAFNRAASKKSERTLKSYLVGSLGEDIDSGVKSLREGKDFSSYIAAEFYDDMKDTCFCVGAVFDTYADGGDITKRFFWLRSQIPQHHFIVDGKTMDSREATKWFKENMPNRYETKDTAEAYKKLLLQRFNVHEEKFFAMMKKAISFEPINDIEKFITENVCDVEDNIDIREMQENILQYRKQEDIAKNFEQKLAALEKIHGQYEEVAKLRSRGEIQRFLIDYAMLEDICKQLEKAYEEAKKYDADIEEFEAKYRELNHKKEELENQKEQLQYDLAAFRMDSNIDNLTKDKERLEKQINESKEKITQFVYMIRTQAMRWCDLFEKCLPQLEEAQVGERPEVCLQKLKTLVSLKDDDLDGLSAGWFTSLREAYREAGDVIRPILSAMQSASREQKELSDTLKSEIEGLKRGLKAYPAKAVRLKEAIAEGLRQKHGKEISVEFLADVIDITDEQWHDAVEGYLNIQRMNIITEPRYFMDAYEIYRSIQFGERIHGYAVVDLEKVFEQERKILPGSLYEVIQAKDPYVKAYMAYLLGRVMRCENDSELRSHKISVTKDCMQYSGYAVKAMDQNAYTTPYIGRGAVQKQIERKTAQLSDLEEERKLTEEKIAAVRPVIEDEWFLSEGFIATTVNDIFERRAMLPKLQEQLEEIYQKLDKIDLFWMQNKEDEIEAVKKEIAAVEAKALETYSFIGEWRQEKQETVNKRIPALQQEQQEAKLHIEQEYAEEFADTVGRARYEQELLRCGSPKAVAEAFSSPLKQTETLLKQAQDRLIDLRGNYNTVQHASFALTNTENNAEFEEEYHKISDYELPKYRERIEKAKQDAMEQFRNDFIYRLRSNINNAYEKTDELNRALKMVQFGNDSYKFDIKPSPAYREYYDMIMSDLLEFGTAGLFGLEFTQRYQTTIDNLFSQILSLSEDDTGKTAQNVEMFSQYKTYLTFDLLSTDSSGRTDKLSKSIFTKSGGETQTPFYIAVLASFAQLYRISDSSEYGNTLRLVIFDEAFNKMDDERITESVKLLRKFGLQAIVCTPPDKAADLQPISDKTLLVHKEQTGKIYSSAVIEWSKEIEEAYGS